MFDIQFEEHGSVVLIRGVSAFGQEWIEANLIHPETQRWGSAVIAEPRYCGAIWKGALADGLEVGR